VQQQTVAPLIISELENTIAEMECSTKAFMCASRNEDAGSAGRSEKRKRLAEYLTRYADEIDQLNARRDT
jgi:hypothetical protein